MFELFPHTYPYWILYIIIFVVSGVFWGWATNRILENKGYGANWFWWGFFFGIIPYVIATTKIDMPAKSKNNLVFSPAISDAKRTQLIAPGGWRCTCGSVNTAVTGTCACGAKKRAAVAFNQKTDGENSTATRNTDR
jgi:hypothetical protein